MRKFGRECGPILHGVGLALEDHGGFAVNSEQRCFYRDPLSSPNFGFVVDTGNFRAIGGEDPFQGVLRTGYSVFLVYV